MIVKGGFANNKFVCGNWTIIKLSGCRNNMASSGTMPSVNSSAHTHYDR